MNRIVTISVMVAMLIVSFGSIAVAKTNKDNSDYYHAVASVGIVESSPCTLGFEEAAEQLTGDVNNAQFFHRGYTAESVWYEGPEVLVTGNRDIVVYDEGGPVVGSYLGYGMTRELSTFFAYCQKLDTPVSEEYVGSCYNGKAFVNGLTGSLDGWTRFDQDIWRYSGDPVTMVVPQEATIKVWQRLDENTLELLIFGAMQLFTSDEFEYTCARDS